MRKQLLILLLVSLGTGSAHARLSPEQQDIGGQAQWVQTDGPYGGFVYCFPGSGSNLFTGTNGGGVFLSKCNP